MPHYRGRFAPSPTGPLHFGSLVSAMASYLEALQHNGDWLLRIDDVDQTRVIPGMDDNIIQSLAALGFEWRQPVRYQSQHKSHYQDALRQLQNIDLVYACHCSRKRWQTQAEAGIDGWVYPDICRDKGLPDSPDHALRVRTPDQIICVNDQLHGLIQQRLHQDIGDFVIRRSDGFFAYQLAVVVDDHLAGINHVVRGADLISSTPRQVYLQQQLGYATPEYLHTPLVYGDEGKKLGKSDAAHPLDIQRPVRTLTAAWHFLRQNKIPDVEHVADFWRWAVQHWDVNQLTTSC